MDYSGWSLLVCDFQRIAPFLLSCQILFLLTCQVYECKVAHRILNYYHLNRYRICRDIPVSSWYWWIVSSLFISLSVLLEVYQFYGFFWRISFCFIDFFCCSLVFSFWLFFILKITRKKSSFSLSFSFEFYSVLYLFFIPSVWEKGSFFRLSKAKHTLPSFGPVFSSGIMPHSVTLLYFSSSFSLAYKFVPISFQPK